MKHCLSILAVAAALVAGGCATKKYVRGEVGGVDSRVTEVEGQVEAAQSDIRRHDEQIARHGQEIEGLSSTARDALQRAEAAGKLAEGKFLYEVALTDDKVRFEFDRAELSADARSFLDGFASNLLAENKNVYIEIQGHTDNIGGDEYNHQLGLERAEAVRRHLNSAGVPLHRMSVISYGESEAIADNGTREGRQQNRRVVLVVLE